MSLIFGDTRLITLQNVFHEHSLMVLANLFLHPLHFQATWIFIPRLVKIEMKRQSACISWLWVAFSFGFWRSFFLKSPGTYVSVYVIQLFYVLVAGMWDRGQGCHLILIQIFFIKVLSISVLNWNVYILYQFLIKHLE